MRARGGSPKAIIAADRRYERLRDKLRDGKLATRIRSLFGGLGGGAFALQVSRRGLDVEAQLELDDDMLLAKLLRDRDGRPPVLAGLEKPPAIMAGLSLDLVAAVKLARAFEAPVAEASIIVGGDLETELAPLLSGDISAFVDPKEDLVDVGGLEDARFGALLGVAKPTKVNEILTRFAGEASEGSVLTNAGPRKWKLSMPGYPELHLALSDAHLVAATSPELTAKLLADGGAVPEGGPGWQLATGEGNAAEIHVEAAAVILSMLGRTDTAPSSPMKRLPWHDPQVPQSQAYQTKLAELNALEEKAAKLDALATKRRARALIAAGHALGAMGAALRRSETGLVLEASYRTTGRTVASAVETLLGGDERFRDPEHRARLAELNSERKRLHAELDAIYEKDEKASPPPPKPTGKDEKKSP
jgi:hypothetical protein